ncbi:MAG: GCN5-related N-acetyltransferase [Herbinix sp.]|nr:GCN5-related N-acetyltransferase [Herbinix sp.]
MKDKAIKYLSKNPLLHMDMMEAIRRNSADLLYADIDGVLIREQNSDAYMITVNDVELGCNLINTISESNLFVAHQENMVELISNKFNLKGKMECFQVVYEQEHMLEVSDEISIRALDLEHIDVILEHYKKLPYSEVKELLEKGTMFGGYKSYMVNRMLQKGQIPFAQIEVNNKASLELQKKLGFCVSEDRVFWLF